jgi:hypothetical protein
MSELVMQGEPADLPNLRNFSKATTSIQRKQSGSHLVQPE